MIHFFFFLHFLYIVCILVWLPDDGRKSDRIMLVNINTPYLLIYLLAYLLTYVFTYLFTYLLTYLLTHSLTHSFHGAEFFLRS